MNYQQTIDYLFSQLPMFQRVGSAAYKANLDNTLAICKLLGNPENKFKSIHVAGTNGKGSTSHMLASVLQSAGLKVGLYTSPHLKDFRERIKINGKMIPEKVVVDFVEAYKADFERIQPSFFEMTVGLAFQYFAKEEVDIAVIEVGLGGRLDSTNVITPLLSVITNISYDHTNLLGDTLQKIAAEKAGIIKPKIPVVIGERQKEIESVFIETAIKNSSELSFANEVFDVQPELAQNRGTQMYSVRGKDGIVFERLECELLGSYQKKNIATVLCALHEINRVGFFITKDNIQEGIRKVVTQTGLLGRWQILSEKPLAIADTGHNEAGIQEVLNQIRSTPHHQLHFVLGMVNDKDISKILSMLPKNAIYYFCKANIPRALAASDLAEQASAVGLNGRVYACVQDAFMAAKSNASEKDLVFVGGSTFTVAEVV